MCTHIQQWKAHCTCNLFCPHCASWMSLEQWLRGNNMWISTWWGIFVHTCHILLNAPINELHDSGISNGWEILRIPHHELHIKTLPLTVTDKEMKKNLSR